MSLSNEQSVILIFISIVVVIVLTWLENRKLKKDVKLELDKAKQVLKHIDKDDTYNMEVTSDAKEMFDDLLLIEQKPYFKKIRVKRRIKQFTDKHRKW